MLECVGGLLERVFEILCACCWQMDAHEDFYSIADDVFESPPLSATLAVDVVVDEMSRYPSK